MQSWDQRQSIISLAGALAVGLIFCQVILNIRIPRFTLLATPFVCAWFYYFNMRRYIRRSRWVRRPFPESWRQILEKHVAYYRQLASGEKKCFERDVCIFLNENRITGIETEVDERVRLLVACSAVLLTFGHPEWEYSKLPEILIYPRSFPEDYSVDSHPGERTLTGIIVPQNGIVISKPELLEAFERPDEPYHVGLHEFAHALDLADGSAEGIPADLHPRRVPEWDQLMQEELRRVRQRQSILNPYAGKNRAELFAVAVEYFFQRSRDLKERHEQLYRAMADFFNQDPAKDRTQMDTDETDRH